MTKLLLISSIMLTGCATISETELMYLGHRLCECHGGLAMAVACGYKCTSITCQDGSQFSNFLPEDKIVNSCNTPFEQK